ncbi:MAG: DNA methylase [Chloroflexi bacterium]|nr:DNA methylase [Chloroflexota bacterium]
MALSAHVAKRKVLDKGSAQGGAVKVEKDPRNRLNDLTGREWVHFLSSVEATAYPTSGPHSYGHNLRRAHPSPKPPQLMRRIVEFFTKEGEWVLDPFMGVGGTLLGCSLAARNAVGLDLSDEYIETYRHVACQEALRPQVALHADARCMMQHTEVAERLFDMVLTDPPYGDMMRRPQSGEKKKKTGRSPATPFTGSPLDLGNLPYEQFLDELTGVLTTAVSALKPSGYLVLFAKDLQPTAQHHNMLHADIVIHLVALSNLAYRGCKIWYNQTPRLYPFGYPYRFVANQLHQYILIFQKNG